MSDIECTAGNKSRSSTQEFTSDGGQPPLDRILEALADEQRRYLCYHLAENGSTDLEECAAVVAAREYNTTPNEIPSDQRQSIEQVLHHRHLPKLDELGILDYDERNGDVRYHHPPPRFEDFLELSCDVETA